MLHVRTANAIGLLSLLAACAAVGVTAMADLYWCETVGSPATFSHNKVEGAECRLVEKDEPAETKPEEKSPVEQQATVRKETERAQALEGFPAVSEDEQLHRDITRGSILKNELEAEIASFKNFRKIIEDNDQVANSPRVREYYMNRLRRHAQNIKALRQEIARL